MIEQAWAALEGLGRHLLSPGFLLSPLYLASTVAIAFLVWRRRGIGGRFLAWLAPREMWRHPSTWLDVKVGLFNAWLLSSSAFAALVVAPVVTHRALEFGADAFGLAPAAGTSVLGGLATAAILFLVQDFCRFLNHYLHHKAPALWPFHAVHHSAEVLTPITFFRAHPVYYAFQRLLMSGLVGLAQAGALLLLVGRVEFWTIYATTLAFQSYMFLGGHLRHSHVDLSYGRALEHVLISPVQHQVHHSSDPKHFDRNFGEVFAIWDWMFGTLYIPERGERLVFGIADAEGRRIAQPYPTLRAALFKPFAESAEVALRWAAARRRPARAPEPAPARAAGRAGEG